MIRLTTLIGKCQGFQQNFRFVMTYNSHPRPDITDIKQGKGLLLRDLEIIAPLKIMSLQSRVSSILNAKLRVKEAFPSQAATTTIFSFVFQPISKACCCERLAVFILEEALCVWTNLGKHSLFVWLFVFSVKTAQDALSV